MEQKTEKFTFAVVTMSDKGSRGEREDTSGAYLLKTLTSEGYIQVSYIIVPDNVPVITKTLIELADKEQVALVVTTGGTGVAPTDVTPEAMQQVIEKEIPGMAEAMRYESMKKTSRAMLSRGKVGIRGATLIVNLPGSLKAVKENLEVLLPVLPHALEKIRGDDGDCGR
ncbi:MogA/MoaB family molybdenum cofactor biosynthesis protein [Desulfopila aestuarii]|uniref:Molybdenum cofactor biosynthesis protein B n=1 Tax=Desulfopila aestuarii DSM 18488 TaxID=1121416 RepID=A0A1M7Y1V8_9BACT|nr:MogA/MoaB family molybdenum cofactor biosynthesis protein [Desulfopila aestuarii]SHO45857.1 molybdopterin adenylyltransferase [Desulfopila aestuarii DSM 18488]